MTEKAAALEEAAQHRHNHHRCRWKCFFGATGLPISAASKPVDLGNGDAAGLDFAFSPTALPGLLLPSGRITRLAPSTTVTREQRNHRRHHHLRLLCSREGSDSGGVIPIRRKKRLKGSGGKSLTKNRTNHRKKGKPSRRAERVNARANGTSTHMLGMYTMRLPRRR